MAKEAQVRFGIFHKTLITMVIVSIIPLGIIWYITYQNTAMRIKQNINGADFAKANDNFELKTAAFNGEVVDVQVLAKLPTYDEAIARLMSVMKEASAGKLARTIAAIRDQKEQEAA